MQDSNTEGRTDVRFYSPQLMMELGHALVEKELLSRPQIDELSSQGALTGQDLHNMILKESLLEERALLGDADLGKGVRAQGRCVRRAEYLEARLPVVPVEDESAPAGRALDAQVQRLRPRRARRQRDETDE